MNDLHEHERRSDQETPADTEDEVRVSMEQTREVLEASGAEIERAKRLLRETESLVDSPVSAPSDKASGPAQADPTAAR